MIILPRTYATVPKFHLRTALASPNPNSQPSILHIIIHFSYIECLHFTLLPLKSPYPSKAKHGDTIR